MRQRDGQHDQARPPRSTMSIARLTHGVEALQRHVVEVDDRDAVEILEPRPQRDELQQVGHDLDVDALAARRLDRRSSICVVLVERQRDVELVDRARAAQISPASRRACRAAAGRGSRGGRRRRGRRRTRRSGSPAPGARESCRRRARPSSPAPAIRIRLRPMPARQRRSSAWRTSSREAKVSATFRTRNSAQTSCDTSSAPRSFSRVGDVVGLEVQRGHDAEDDGDDAADEDREEVVDARAVPRGAR